LFTTNEDFLWTLAKNKKNKNKNRLSRAIRSNKMGDTITVLITGGGAPGIAGTIFSLRNNPENTDFVIITTDINNDVIGKYLADKFHKVPPPENEEYIPTLLKLAKKQEVQVIIPQTTREITVLSNNANKFAALGTTVMVSPFQSIQLANDKFLLLEKAQQIKVPCPRYYLTNSKTSLTKAVKLLGYPEKKVVVKPRTSNGMRGLRILVEEPWDVRRFLSEKPQGVEISLDVLLDILERGTWPELVVTEYLPGQEYTVDVFRGKKGMVILPRLREKIRDGITFCAKVDLRTDLIEYSSKLTKALNLTYCFGFQFKSSKDNIPKLLESNPRIQGTMAASALAGFNLIYCSVMEALGKQVEIDNLNLKDGLKFERYWGGVAVDKDGVVRKI